MQQEFQDNFEIYKFKNDFNLTRGNGVLVKSDRESNNVFWSAINDRLKLTE